MDTLEEMKRIQWAKWDAESARIKAAIDYYNRDNAHRTARYQCIIVPAGERSERYVADKMARGYRARHLMEGVHAVLSKCEHGEFEAPHANSWGYIEGTPMNNRLVRLYELAKVVYPLGVPVINLSYMYDPHEALDDGRPTHNRAPVVEPVVEVWWGD